MKRIIAEIFLFLVCLALCGLTTAHAGEIRYVSGLALGTGDGTEPNPWTLAQLNAADISDNSIIRIVSDIPSGLTLAGSSAILGLTIQGYGYSGTDYPTIGDDSARPITIAAANVAADLLIFDLKITGQEWTAIKAEMVAITGVINVTIKQFKLFGFAAQTETVPAADQVGKNGIILTSGCAGTLLVQDGEICNLGPRDMPTDGEDIIGIYASGMADGAVLTVRRVYAHHIQADGSQVVGTPNSRVVYDDCDFDSFGENGIDLKYCQSPIIRNCRFRREDFTGGGGTSATYAKAIVIHEGTDLGGSNYPEITRCYFEDQDQAIDVAGQNGYRQRGAVIDGNRFVECGYRTENTTSYVIISTGSYWDNYIISGNYAYNPTQRAAAFLNGNATAGAAAAIYNNTVDGHYASIISTAGGPINHLRNNIFVNQASGATDYVLSLGDAASRPAFSDNNIYWMPNKPADQVWIYWYSMSGTQISYTGEQQAAWQAAYPGHADDRFADPKLMEGSGRPKPNSPAIDAAASVAMTVHAMGGGEFDRFTSSVNPRGWSKTLAGSSTVNADSNVEYDGGAWCLRFSIDASNNHIAIYQTQYPLAESTYLLSYWQRKSAAGDLGVYWILTTTIDETQSWYDASGDEWVTAGEVRNSTAIAAATTWEQVTKSIVMPAGIESAVFTFGSSGADAASKYIYLDAASLVLDTSGWVRTRDAGDIGRIGTSWDLGFREFFRADTRIMIAQ